MALPLLVYLVPTLLAAGGAAWEWVRPDKYPEWADKDAFNDRMRRLHSAILELNTALAKCKAFMADKDSLQAWRNFKSNWSAFYGSVGTLNYFGPSDAEIATALDYTSKLLQWGKLLGEYKDCSAAPAPGQPPMPNEPSENIGPAGLLFAGLGLLGYLLSKAKR